MNDNNVKFEGSNWSLVDQVLDYIPFVSTISNGIVALRVKEIAKKKLKSLKTDTQPSKPIKQHYWTHIKNKTGLRIFFGCIPGIGNAILLGSDLIRGIRYLLVRWNPESLKNKDPDFQRDFLLTHPKGMQRYKQYVNPKLQKKFFIEKSPSVHESDDTSLEGEKLNPKSRKRKFEGDDKDVHVQPNKPLDDEEDLIESSSEDEVSNETQNFVLKNSKEEGSDSSSRYSIELIPPRSSDKGQDNKIFNNPWGSKSKGSDVENQEVLKSLKERSESTETPENKSFVVCDIKRAPPEMINPQENKEGYDNIMKKIKETEEFLEKVKQGLEKPN